jgi:hypothetical protein
MRRRLCQVAVCLIVSTWLGGDVGATPLNTRATSGSPTSLTGPALSCSTPLRLYDGSLISGDSVSISTRGLWIDLSTLGFDNRTSSFKVGACSIELAAGPGGSGSRYQRCLSAGCTENNMATGWNNLVSSAYLH